MALDPACDVMLAYEQARLLLSAVWCPRARPLSPATAPRLWAPPSADSPARAPDDPPPAPRPPPRTELRAAAPGPRLPHPRHHPRLDRRAHGQVARGDHRHQGGEAPPAQPPKPSWVAWRAALRFCASRPGADGRSPPQHPPQEPSDNYYHFNDNRILPPNVDAERATAEGARAWRAASANRLGTRATASPASSSLCGALSARFLLAGWWYKPDYIFNELNINSGECYCVPPARLCAAVLRHPPRLAPSTHALARCPAPPPSSHGLPRPRGDAVGGRGRGRLRGVHGEGVRLHGRRPEDHPRRGVPRQRHHVALGGDGPPGEADQVREVLGLGLLEREAGREADRRRPGDLLPRVGRRQQHAAGLHHVERDGHGEQLLLPRPRAQARHPAASRCLSRGARRASARSASV